MLKKLPEVPRMKIRAVVAIGVALAAVLATAEPAAACPVCFGATDSPMAQGINNGIVFLLGIVGMVQLGFVALFVSVRRRAQDHQDPKDSFDVINGGLR